MSVTVYGASDDLIEIEGDIREEFIYPSLDDDGDGVFLAFSSGHVLRIRYSSSGVWRIEPVFSAGELRIEQAPENDDDKYTDVAVIDGAAFQGFRWVVLGTQLAN